MWDINGKVIHAVNKQPLSEGEAAGDGDGRAGGGDRVGPVAWR